MNQTVDIAIIGAGSAGLSALQQVRKITDNFLIIDPGPLGTTCARTGCMPSKALIQVSRDVERCRHLDGQGIHGTNRPAIDLPKVLRHVRRVRDRFTRAMIETTHRRAGKHLLEGRAEFLSPNRLRVGDRRIDAGRIILATGSKPAVPNAWQEFGDRILTSETIFEQTDLPPRLAVIGLGAIGLELGQALSRLDLKIHAFSLLKTIGGLSDPDVNRVARNRIHEEFPLHLGAEARIRAKGAALDIECGEIHETVDHVLVATGIRPNLDGLGLEKLDLPRDEHGMPQCDPLTAQIGDLPIYLAGDANGKRPLLHEALDEGFLAGRNATAREPHDSCRRIPLRIVFSEPQIAVVGRSFADLAQEKFIAGSVDFENQSRAIIAGVNDGLLKVYVDPQSARILGSEMAVPAAEHLAHLLALCIQREMTVFDLLRMPFYHPTIEEGLRSALRDAARSVSQPQTEAGTAYCEICPEPPLR